MFKKKLSDLTAWQFIIVLLLAVFLCYLIFALVTMSFMYYVNMSMMRNQHNFK